MNQAGARGRSLVLASLCCVVFLSARTNPKAPPAPAAAQAVPEVLRTPDWPRDDVDSVAVWRDGQGGARLFVTAKQADVVYVCDGVTGRQVAILGRRGSKPGEFLRPNGVAVIDDWLLVTERDNHRVQVFELPSLRPRAIFGQNVLVKPYGLTAFRDGAGCELYVTDDYEAGNLGARVKHFLLTKTDGGLEAKLVRAFGELRGPGALQKVESILADPGRNRLYVCDEVTRELKVYDLAGNFTGATLGRGIIKFDPEGLALFEDKSQKSGGWLVVTDQGPKQTVLNVFARNDGRYVGAVTGRPALANTDGIWLSPGDLGPFQRGALYCVHNDLRVQAYSWADLEKALKLK